MQISRNRHTMVIPLVSISVGVERTVAAWTVKIKEEISDAEKLKRD